MNGNLQKQRVKKITEQLEQGIKDLFESEQYRNWLTTMSRFHQYSLNNTILICLQKPDASLVAGFHAWKKMGRHVKKGEKGILILAPIRYAREQSNAEEEPRKPHEAEKEKTEKKEMICTGYSFKNMDGKYLNLAYTYDTLGRVSDMLYTKEDGTIVERHSYEYDKNNNIVREVNENALTGLHESRTYTYDYAGQLKESIISNITTTTSEISTGEVDDNGIDIKETKITVTETPYLTTAYTYDRVGNRLTKVENGSTTTYTYNGLNQLVTEAGNGTLTYGYDSNGNQISITGGDAAKYFTYTPSGMLASYTCGSDSQANLYNGEGQRVQKTEGSDVTNYFYQQGGVLYTTDGSGDLKAFNLLNVSDAFATSRVSGTAENYYFYTEDQRGSTVNVLDSSGNRVVSYWYSDFGEVIENKASGYTNFVNEIQYTGAIYDELTGLLYLNARFYDPSTGRFITQDTYRGERNNADTWHLYAYCANNPINMVDPTGHFAISRGLVALGLDFAIGWGINRFAANIVSKSAFSVLKKGFKEIYLESRTKKAVSEFVKAAKKTASSMANKFSTQFSKIMSQLERSPLYKLSTIFKKSEKEWLKKKMKTVAKKGIVTILTDKLTTYINNALKYGAIDCLLSPGGFLAGALELKIDGNLDGKIEF